MLSLLFRLADLARHRARIRLWDPKAASGRRGEDLAHRLLRQKGMRVVARNYRPRFGTGEIDLIARDGAQLVFVEVKSRGDEEFGSPDRAIDREKRKALVCAAQEYARRANVSWDQVRFDVVSVILSGEPKISHIAGAIAVGQRL
jgi:putative endonuclease